jgi:3-phenylpropionate/cinnamic acid dioxygenase small subunit
MTTTVTENALRRQLSDPRVNRAIELVWQEAQLLDAKDYESWEKLYAPDGRYVIPIDPDTQDFESTLNMVYDDARMRRMRVTRMVEGYAISAVDAARTARTVSRFPVAEVTDEKVVLNAAQILVGFKRGTHSVLGADVHYEIRLGEEQDLIVLKVIRLLNSDSSVNASGYLL